MKMKMFSIWTVLFCFTSSFWGCEDDKTQEKTDFTLDNVYYYDYYDTFKYIPISTDDTIHSNVGRTLAIVIEATTSDEIEIQSTQKDLVEIDEIESGTQSRVFHIYFKQTSQMTINIINSSSEKFVSFHVDVAPLTIIYSTITSSEIADSDVVYTVAGAVKDSLKHEIINELKSKYSLKKGDLIYSSFTEGEFQATIGDNEDIIGGTFTVDVLDDGYNFIFLSSDNVYNIFAKQSDSYSSGYYLIQDLTEKYQLKYPSEAITKVEISQFVLTNYQRLLTSE